ncbi:hypothetical protein DPMN_100809 [Dreissena polymorpha]|uniref:FAS1 domain-containing protein n=1 Tax=Dreissena polymorpha TaxID=45954 RepID=A0A9D4LHK8_DREPO|nr:hypothetical protein DPMN_100809 [Dreissena polymorpha]
MIRNLALLLVVSVCGCRALSTVETLASDPNFSSLVSALTQAGLIDTLNQGVFTIFAPSNFYFETLKYIDPHGLLTDAALFKSVLLYHVVAGRVMRANMTNEHTVTSVQGKPIRFNTYQHNHVTTAQGYQIIFFDKTADNGVIHVITNIMMPPKGDIVNIVSNDNETSTLLSFAVTAGIVGALQGDGLTLLAPTNAAFSQLPNATLSQLTGNVALLTGLCHTDVNNNICRFLHRTLHQIISRLPHRCEQEYLQIRTPDDAPEYSSDSYKGQCTRVSADSHTEQCTIISADSNTGQC